MFTFDTGALSYGSSHQYGPDDGSGSTGSINNQHQYREQVWGSQLSYIFCVCFLCHLFLCMYICFSCGIGIYIRLASAGMVGQADVESN